MTTRIIKGLQWARLASAAPHKEPRRLKGAKAAGLRYEKDLAEGLGPRAQRGIWFEFCDSNGRGFCQPDVLLRKGPKEVIIFESKYTWTLQGHQQLENLYRPVVQHVLPDYQLYTVQVCKMLLPETPKAAICASLEEALTKSAFGKLAVLHWMGASLEPLRLRLASGHLASGIAAE